VAATSAASGNVTVIPGAATLPASGTVAGVSGTSGSVSGVYAIEGTTASVTGAQGAATSQLAVTGTVAATSDTTCDVRNAGPPRDVLITGALLPQRLAGTLDGPRLTGVLEATTPVDHPTGVRLVGTLLGPRLTGSLEDT